MQFRVLGPVEFVVGGECRTVPRAQARGVLALLAMNAGSALSVDAIVEALWDGAAPSTSRSQVHSAVSAIRRRLGHDDGARAIVAGPFGYRLADGHRVDLAAFDQYRRASRLAAARGDPAGAARLLRDALDWWAGEPLGGAAGAFVGPTKARLIDKRLSAVEDLADLELGLGRHPVVAEELATLVDAHPLREPLRARYMLALYRCGRRCQALESYRSYRRRLIEAEGLDPGVELATLQTAMLRDARDLD